MAAAHTPKSRRSEAAGIGSEPAPHLEAIIPDRVFRIYRTYSWILASLPRHPRNQTTEDPSDCDSNKVSVPRLTINGARNPDLNCRAGSFVAPGDTPAFDWGTADVSFWFYAGPIRIHPASCGDAPCSEVDSTKAGRFEIHQVGKKANPVRIFLSLYDKKKLINRCNATCTQIRIGGSGAGVPSKGELVSFPGAYSDNDAGILVRNVFDKRLNYQFPGPAVSRLSGTAAPARDSTPSSTSTLLSGNGNGNSGSSSGSKKTCTLKKNASKSAAPFYDPHFVPPPPCIASHRHQAHLIFRTLIVVRGIHSPIALSNLAYREAKYTVLPIYLSISFMASIS
ncbi:hypothetical protein H1R20_g8891, partial [Candolleomyces eurysporus]